MVESAIMTGLLDFPWTSPALSQHHSVVLTDASASSVVKRTADLFTEAEMDALQPAAHGAKEAIRDILAAGAGDKSQQSENADKTNVTSGVAGESLQKGKEEAVNKSTKHDDEEEHDGYLSDDPEERYDAQQATLRALFNLWRKDLNMEIEATTKFQELTALFLNKKQYCWLQVTFERACDANFMWKHEIVHTYVDGKRINLDWQHPVDPAYVKARAADAQLVEVLFKGVDAVITPEMLCEMLVKVKLEKRGRSAFKEGCCFHWVVNTVIGMDTDKIKGLVKQHDGDKYRWRHLIEDPTSHDKQLLVHYPSLICAHFEGTSCGADPMGNREE
ncbi:unnamed protein product [Closterium sp. Naga37s-1]|nr:unnamed protein product [Closterium sp. Naga37s-1]